MEAIISRWEKLPEPARWILCWPAIIVLTVLSSIAISLFMWFSSLFTGGDGYSFTDGYIPNNIASLISWMISIGMLNFLMFSAILYVCPRGQDIIAAFVAFFLVIIGAYGSYATIAEDALSIYQQIGVGIQGLFGTVAPILCAALVRKAIKDNSRELTWFTD